MEYEEAKAKIVEGLQKKAKSKSKFYFNDLSKLLELKPREAKKISEQTGGRRHSRILVQREHVDVWPQGCR
jgi:hypothetical protein